jgi:membrane protein DedA with SNARE-associated domain
MLPMLVVLAVPIVPFLIFGQEGMERALNDWRENPPPPSVVTAAVVALLATDIFLPVPSSLVSTLAGWQLGAIGGTAASWIGMTIGAAIGFALAQWFGQPAVAWLTRPADLVRTQLLAERFGPTLLVLGRGIPVLAEATVLLLGMHGMSWKRFLPPVLLANFGLALAYSVFGQLAERYHLLPLAIAIAIALPVAMIAAFKAFTPANRPSGHRGNGTSERLDGPTFPQ